MKQIILERMKKEGTSFTDATMVITPGLPICPEGTYPREVTDGYVTPKTIYFDSDDNEVLPTERSAVIDINQVTSLGGINAQWNVKYPIDFNKEIFNKLDDNGDPIADIDKALEIVSAWGWKQVS